MKRDEIMNTIKMLASSQGFYSRLYRDIKQIEGTPNYDALMDLLEAQDFEDSVDLVMYFES